METGAARDDAARMAAPQDPFRGSSALRNGRVTKNELRGPRFRRMFPDVYLPAALPADLATRSRGAALILPERGVLSGYSAAQLLGARCAPTDADVEITVPGGDFRTRSGLTVHRDLLRDDEVCTRGGIPLTTELRTAWDLARWLPTVDAVVAVDALARTGGFAPSRLLRIQDHYPRARWRACVPGVVDLANPLAESAMESRARLVLVLRGLPRPALQYEVFDERGQFVARLDMAYPELRIGIEYDGRGHLTRWEQERDARRQNALDACGWSLLRLTSPDIWVHPDDTAERVRSSRRRRLRARA